MIDFGLSDDQAALQAAARDFLAVECPPTLLRETVRAADGVPRALYAKMAELGWMGLLVPEAQGGLGLGPLELVLVLEELGRAAAPGPFLPTQLVVAALRRGGSAAQRATWLRRLGTGDAFGALAYLEEGDQHTPAGIQLRAKRKRDGWELSGEKLFVLEAPAADVLLVAARTRPASGAAGVSLFLVDRAASGVRVRPQEVFDVTRRVAELAFRGVAVPRDALVGREGEGWPVLAHLLDVAAVGIAADSLGGATRTLEMAVQYTKEREQFGRKVASFQAIKHIAAEMAAEVEPSRSLVWYGAYTLDAMPRQAARAAAMAKARLGDVYMRTARRAVEMHGGMGFTWEHDLHFWFKRAHLNAVLFGKSDFHRERVAAIDRY